MKNNIFFIDLIEKVPRRILQIPFGKMTGMLWGGVFFWGISLFYAGFSGISLFLSLFLAFLLIWISIIDIRWHIIPFPITCIGTIILGIARCWTIPDVTCGQILVELGVIAGIGILILGLYYLIRRRKGWGWGDTFLWILVVSHLGLLNTCIAFLGAFLIASIWGMRLLIKYKKRLKTQLPMAPFITLGVFITQVWGNQILSFLTHTFVFF